MSAPGTKRTDVWPMSALSEERTLHSLQIYRKSLMPALANLIIVRKERFGHKIDEHAYFG